MTKETYETVITALAESIKSKENALLLKDYEISDLKKKLKDAEKLLANNRERIETR